MMGDEFERDDEVPATKVIGVQQEQEIPGHVLATAILILQGFLGNREEFSARTRPDKETAMDAVALMNRCIGDPEKHFKTKFPAGSDELEFALGQGLERADIVDLHVKMARVVNGIAAAHRRVEVPAEDRAMEA